MNRIKTDQNIKEKKGGLWQELTKDSFLQKEINQETLTLDHLFKKALQDMDIILSDPKMIAKRYIVRDLYGIIPIAKKIIDEENKRINIEIKRQVAEMRALSERLNKK